MMDYLPDDLERKDGNPEDAPPASNAPDTLQIKSIVESYMNTVVEGLRKTADETKKPDVLLDEKQARIDAQLLKLENEVKSLRSQNNTPPSGEPKLDTKEGREAQEHLEIKAWRDYVRFGITEDPRLAHKNAILGQDPKGGYFAPVTLSTTIDRIISEVSPIRSIAQVMNISTNSYSAPTVTSGASAGWVGETSSRPATVAPEIDVQNYPTRELYAMPLASQTLLDDASVNIEEWLASEIQMEFAEQEGTAFVNGNGVNQPHGFLNYDTVANGSWAWGKLGYVITGTSGAFKTTAAGDNADNLMDLVYGLKNAFRQNASFVMNRSLQNDVRKMKDSQGNYFWRPGLQQGQPDSLLGYPIVEAEDMPNRAANSFSIAFGDFRRGYLIVDRTGVRVLRDPYSQKPYIQLYTTKRVGGGVKHFDAIKLLKFGTS